MVVPSWILPAIASLFWNYPSKNPDLKSLPRETTLLAEEYDFIIIGGGTAGSVVSNRLTEDIDNKVLLLEAGGPETTHSQVPALAPYLQLSEHDWKYKAEPSSTSCLAMINNRCNLPRGKIIGGSSSINYMIYVRGNKHDYDLWDDLGNAGWSYADVLPFFKKFEDNNDEEISKDSTYHSTGGPQKVSRPPWHTPLASAYQEASSELGYPSRDINGEEQTGFMIPQGYIENGERFSSAKAYLRHIRDRENLDVLLNALVTKIHFDESLRATGVSFEWNGSNYTAKTRKEVILSAGAIGSPHLLMLSGIGVKSHLSKFNITSLVDLAVGRNLQDHVASMLIFSLEERVSLLQSRVEGIVSLAKYMTLGTGPLTSLGGIEGIAFINTKYANKSKDWPDIELHFASGSPASDGGNYLRHTLNLRQEYWEDYLAGLATGDSYSIIFKLMRPRSVGHVELSSVNPKIHPKIKTNYLTEAYDLFVMQDAMKTVKKIGETNALKKFGSKLLSIPLPGCEKFDQEIEEYLECYLRHFTLTLYHYCGTVKMGPYWDPEAVVDSKLRVYGTSGLRVIDASIFPTIPTGNTNAAVLMVAEKASQIIKDYYKDSTLEEDSLPSNTYTRRSTSVPAESQALTNLSIPKVVEKDVEETQVKFDDSYDSEQRERGAYVPNPRFKIYNATLEEDEL